MPLAFDERHLLPPGVHDATLSEVETHFGRFSRTDRRSVLFRKLTAYLREVERTGWKCQVILDGSFVMPPIDEPNDIDLLLVLPPDWDMSGPLLPVHYNIVSIRQVRRAYDIEVFPVLAGSSREAHFLDFFGNIRNDRCREHGWSPDSRKGLVRIVQ